MPTLSLFAVILLSASAAFPFSLGKEKFFPAESLTVNYLSHELRLVASADSNATPVDSARKMTYVEFRLDTLVFEYRVAKDTALQRLRVPRTRITGFYYNPSKDHIPSPVILGGLAVVLLFFLL